MPSYRLAANGYVDGVLNDADLTSCLRNLLVLRNNSYQEFDLIIEGHVAVETLREANKLCGNRFAQWLTINFDGGRGPLSALIRDIVHYLNGKQGYLSVHTSLNIQEGILKDAAKQRSKIYQPTHRVGSGEQLLKPGYTLQDYDLYRLASGIGPSGIGRLFLLLGGEAYYV